MNVVRSFLSGVLRPSLPSLTNLNLIRSVTQKPPGKRTDLPGKKNAVVIPATFIPYHERPRQPNKKTGRKTRLHPHPMPKVDWKIDLTIPRRSVLSFQPLSNHHWHDWRMLRDVRKRAYVAKDGRVRLRLRALMKSNLLPKELFEYVTEDIRKLPRDSCYIRMHDRCVVTSRPRGLVSRTRMSRIVWRNLADHNQISGCMRAKWGNRNNPVYYHNIDPDLHGTLRAVDPLTGPMSLGVEREYEIWESIYMGQQRPTLQSMYNQNVFKKEPFVYPKKF